MAYDGVYALKQGIDEAGSIDTDRVKDAMKGMTVDTTRGRLFFRDIDNQLSVSAYFGRVADDPAYTEALDRVAPAGAKSIWRSLLVAQYANCMASFCFLE